MFLRIITGIILAGLVSIGIIYLPIPGLKAVIAILAGIAAHEAARMILSQDNNASIWFPVVGSVALSCLLMFGPKDFFIPLGGVTLAFILTFSFYLFRLQEMTRALDQVARTLLIILYVGVLFSFLGFIRDLPLGWAWLFLVLACTFGADTGAYFAGRHLGRHKLAPKVSPGKTIEGFLGGILASIGVAFLVKFIIYNGFSNFQCVAVGTLVGVVGPAGDLAESLIKRSVGVKDSGKLIPGHGGMLDRVDALLFTAPVVYAYAFLFGSRG